MWSLISFPDSPWHKLNIRCWIINWIINWTTRSSDKPFHRCNARQKYFGVTCTAITSFDQSTTGQTSAAPRMRGPGVAVLSVPVNSPVSNKIFRLTSTKIFGEFAVLDSRINETAENEYGNATTKYYLPLHWKKEAFWQFVIMNEGWKWNCQKHSCLFYIITSINNETSVALQKQV